MTPTPKKKPRQRKLERDRARQAAEKKQTSTRHAAAKKAAKSKRVKTAKKPAKRHEELTEPKRDSKREQPTANLRRPGPASVSGRPRRSVADSSKPNRSARSERAQPEVPRRPSRSKPAQSDKGHRTAADSGKPRRPVHSESARPDKPRRAATQSGTRSAEVSTTAARPTRTNVTGAKQQRPPRSDSQAMSATPENAIDVSSWAELGVAPEFLPLLRRMGISTPFPIQALTLPDALAHRDVLGRAQTGSGKTLAFGLAMLSSLANRRAQPHQPLGLVLVPTRELAMQVTDALAPFAQAVGLDIRLIAGGMPYARQIDALRRAVPVLVATPGRLNDLIAQGHVRLSDVEVTVLDEADQMCDMGFAPQITEVLDLTPPTGQRLLFSATLDGDVDAIVRRYLNHPIMHSTVSGEARVDTMEHFLFVVHSEDKPQVVARIASRAGKTMLFGRTQLGVERIAKELMHQGVACGALHGGKSQAVRTKTLQQFKDGVTSVLVATDVAARGIHVEGVSLVVHVDPPKDPKDYVHRAGRTARAGAAGAVVTIVGPRQQKSVLAMMTRAGVTPEVVRIRLTSPELGVITGARQPSGVPWHPPAARTAQRGRRAASQGGRRRPVARPAKTRISG